MSADTAKVVPGEDFAAGPVHRALGAGAIALALMLGPVVPAPAQPSSGHCRLVLLAEWPVQFHRNLPLVDGSINGQPVRILLDTGGINFIARSAALRLGLRVQTDPRRIVLGTGGYSQVDFTSVHELRVGNVVNRRLVIDVTGERETGWAMTLGKEFFENYDVEFDLPGKAVRIFEIKDCTAAQLSNWAGENTGELQMETRMEAGSNVVVPVKINGRPFRALLDSGASTSVVRTPAVKELGITPQTPGVTPGGCMGGIGSHRVDVWTSAFQSFAIGNEVIHDPTLHFGDLTRDHPFPDKSGVPDMLLGNDFLRTHRVLIAYSQRKVYFTYAGGTVFPISIGKPCADSSAGKG